MPLVIQYNMTVRRCILKGLLTITGILLYAEQVSVGTQQGVIYDLVFVGMLQETAVHFVSVLVISLILEYFDNNNYTV